MNNLFLLMKQKSLGLMMLEKNLKNKKIQNKSNELIQKMVCF